MNKTKIEWCRNPDGSQGYTWNPITGCLNNCSYCYARKLANGRLRSRYLANTNFVYTDSGNLEHLVDPFYPRFWIDRCGEGALMPDFKGKPRGIFACDQGEYAGDWVPGSWQYWLFEVIRRCPFHRFYLLTKQPQNLVQFSPFSPNAWVGVTATNQRAYDIGASLLSQVEATVKFMSLEPLLEPIILPYYNRAFDWVIIGAQTQPTVMPRREWVKRIVKAADDAGIPVFLKDNLKPLMGSDLMQEFPE